MEANHMTPELSWAEFLRIFEQHSRRRDFLMKQDGNTPRFMSNVSGNAVAEHSPLIPAIYHNSQLMDFLSLWYCRNSSVCSTRYF